MFFSRDFWLLLLPPLLCLQGKVIPTCNQNPNSTPLHFSKLRERRGRESNTLLLRERELTGLPVGIASLRAKSRIAAPPLHRNSGHAVKQSRRLCVSLSGTSVCSFGPSQPLTLNGTRWTLQRSILFHLSPSCFHPFHPPTPSVPLGPLLLAEHAPFFTDRAFVVIAEPSARTACQTASTGKGAVESLTSWSCSSRSCLV